MKTHRFSLFLFSLLILSFVPCSLGLTITKSIQVNQRIIPEPDSDEILIHYEVPLDKTIQIKDYSLDFTAIPETIGPMGNYSVVQLGSNKLQCILEESMKCNLTDLGPLFSQATGLLSFDLKISGKGIPTFYFNSLILSDSQRDSKIKEIDVSSDQASYFPVEIDIGNSFAAEISLKDNREDFLYIETSGTTWQVYEMVLRVSSDPNSEPIASSLVRIDHSESFSRIMRVPIEVLSQLDQVFLHFYTSQRAKISFITFLYLSSESRNFSETVVDVVNGAECNQYTLDQLDLEMDANIEISVTEREGEITVVALKNQNNQNIVHCFIQKADECQNDSREGILYQWDGNSLFINLSRDFLQVFLFESSLKLEVCGADDSSHPSSFLLGMLAKDEEYKRYHANSELDVRLEGFGSEIFWMSLENKDFSKNLTMTVSSLSMIYSKIDAKVGICGLTNQSIDSCFDSEFNGFSGFEAPESQFVNWGTEAIYQVDLEKMKDFFQQDNQTPKNFVLIVFMKSLVSESLGTLEIEIESGSGFVSAEPGAISYFDVGKGEIVQVLFDAVLSKENHEVSSMNLVFLNIYGNTKVKIYQMSEDARLSTLYEDTGLSLPTTSRIVTLKGQLIQPGTIFCNVTGLTDSQFYIRTTLGDGTDSSEALPVPLNSKFTDALFYNQSRIIMVPVENSGSNQFLFVTVFFAQTEGAGEALIGVNRIPTKYANDGKFDSKEVSSKSIRAKIQGNGVIYLVIQPIVYTAEAAIDNELDLFYEVFVEVNDQSQSPLVYPLSNQVTFRDFLGTGQTFKGIFTVPLSDYIKKIAIMVESGLPLIVTWSFFEDPDRKFEIASGSNTIDFEEFEKLEPVGQTQPVKMVICLENHNTKDVAFSLLVTSANVEYLSMGSPVSFPIPDARESTYLVLVTNSTIGITLQLSEIGDDFEVKYLVKTTVLDFERITPDQIAFNSKAAKFANDYTFQIDSKKLEQCFKTCTVLFKITNQGAENHSFSKGKAIVSYFNVTSMVIDRPYYVEGIQPEKYDYYFLEVTDRDYCRPRIILMPFRGGEVDLYVNSGRESSFPSTSHANFVSREVGGDFIDLERGVMGPYEISVYNPGAVEAGYTLSVVCLSESSDYLQEIETGRVESFPIRSEMEYFFYFVSEEKDLLIHVNTNMNARCEVFMNTALLELAPKNTSTSQLARSIIPSTNSSEYKEIFISSDPLGQNWIEAKEAEGGSQSNDTLGVLGVICNQKGFIDIYVKSKGHFLQLYDGYQINDRIDQPGTPNYYSITMPPDENSYLTISFNEVIPEGLLTSVIILVNFESLADFPSSRTSKYNARETIVFSKTISLYFPKENLKSESVFIAINSTSMSLSYSLVLASAQSDRAIRENVEFSVVLRANESQTFMLASSSNQTKARSDLVISYSFECEESESRPKIAKCIRPILSGYYIKQKSSTISLASRQPVEIVLALDGDKSGVARFKAETMSYYFLTFSNSPNSTSESTIPDFMRIDFSVTFFDALNLLDLPFDTVHPGILSPEGPDLFAVSCGTKEMISIKFTVCSGGLDIGISSSLNDTLSERFGTRDVIFSENEMKKKCEEDQMFYLRVKYSEAHNELIEKQAVYKLEVNEATSESKQIIKPSNNSVKLTHRVGQGEFGSLEVEAESANYLSQLTPSCNETSHHILMVAGHAADAISFVLKCPELSSSISQISSSALDYKSESCSDQKCVVKKTLNGDFSLVGVRQDMSFEGECQSKTFSQIYPVMAIPEPKTNLFRFLGVDIVSLLVILVAFLLVFCTGVLLKTCLNLRRANKIINQYERANELTSSFPNTDTRLGY